MENPIYQALISKANEIAAADFMAYPDYDPDQAIQDLPGAITIVLADHLEDFPSAEVYDFFNSILSTEQ